MIASEGFLTWLVTLSLSVVAIAVVTLLGLWIRDVVKGELW